MDDKNALLYEDFLNEVNPASREFVGQIHDYFMESGCKLKIELAKSGHVVSYSHAKTKRVIVNFVFRKNALIIRIYGDHVNKYAGFMEALPEGMVKAIEKAPVCKRLIDPSACNPKCGMGYDFDLNGTRYQKCRYNSFMFEVNDVNIPYIKEFVENECRERTA